MLIQVTLANGCIYEEIWTEFTQEPIEYKAGETGLVQISPTWEQSGAAPGCPATYTLERMEDSSVPRPLTTYESGFVSIDPADGTVRILANSEDKDGL